MRREMIVGCVIGMILGGLVDLLLRIDGLGLIGGAVVGGVVGHFLIPARERAVAHGGGDGGSSDGTAAWMGDTTNSDSDCADSGSDGGSCDGGGDGGGGGGGD